MARDHNPRIKSEHLICNANEIDTISPILRHWSLSWFESRSTGARRRAQRSSRLVVVPSTTGATIPPLFTSGTRCAPEHTRRKLDGRRIDKETSTNEGCPERAEKKEGRRAEGGEIERGMMETRRGIETRPMSKGERRKRRKRMGERERENKRGSRETCRGRNEFEKGLSALFRVVSIAAAYRSDGIIAAGSSDLKFSHLCRESTTVHISSRGACTAPLRRRRAAAPGTRSICNVRSISRTNKHFPSCCTLRSHYPRRAVLLVHCNMSRERGAI